MLLNKNTRGSGWMNSLGGPTFRNSHIAKIENIVFKYPTVLGTEIKKYDIIINLYYT